MVSNSSPPDSAAGQPKRRGRPPGGITLESLRPVLNEQTALIVAHVDEQINGIQTRVSALEQSIPDPQTIVDRVAAVLGPELSQQISKKLEMQAARATEIATNGHRPVGETPATAPGGQPRLSDRITDWTNIAGAVADVLLSKYSTFKQDARLDRQEARYDRMVETNPFHLADTMRAANNPMFPLYAAAFAPLPQAVAEARVRETTDAVLIGMRARAEATRILREEATRQREPRSQDSPNSSGSPITTSPPSPTKPSAGVNMTSKDGLPSKPRLTLREVMG